MSTRPTSLALALCVATLLPAAARASEPSHAFTIDLGLMHSNGVTPDPKFTYPAFPFVGLGGQLYGGPLVVGLRADLAHDVLFGRTEIFGHLYTGLEAASSVSSFAATVELGGHEYSDVGDSFFGNYDSPAPLLPSVGGQVRLGFFGRHNASVGLSAFVRRDLAGTMITAVHKQTDSFFDTGDPRVDYHVGGTTVGVALGVALPRPKAP
jgi:hypothetical protein